MLISDANEYRYWKTVRAIGFTLLIFFVFLNLFGLVALFMQGVLSVSTGDPVATEVGYQLFYGAGYLLSFLLPILFLKLMIRKSGFAYQPVRLQAEMTPWLPLILFAGVSVILATAYLNASMISIFSFADFDKIMPAASSNGEWYLVVLDFLVLCLIPAVCEELLFRGAILTNLLPFGRSSAILISALLFALMHENLAQFFYTFCAGIVLGLVYERTKSIWCCIFLHLFNNFFSTFETEFANAFGNRLSSVAVIALEAFLMAIGLICAVLLIIHYSPQKNTFREGIYGKSIQTDDGFAFCPVSAKMKVKRFFNVSTILVMVISLSEAVMLLFLLPIL